jgi:hypothetical protein
MLAASALLAALLAAAPAHALQQPDGTSIPVIDPSVVVCSDRNVQVCLDAEEGGPTIDAMAAAAVTPETYVPGCALTFRVIARGAGYLNTFGWYNVDPNGPPAAADLHSFLECSDAVGTTKVLDISSDPHYLGGLVGFFMATPQGTAGNCPTFDPNGGPVPGTVGYIYYSQRAYNPDNQGPDSWVHLITYDSITYPSSFYFAWEDLLSGGDNDFDDLLTRVEGIQCAGGGAPCDTGQLGNCAFGMMQCHNGGLECVQNQLPTAESCNALDDDCNGLVDDGDLCPPSYVCFRGECVPECGNGEFVCPNDLVCNPEGLCVDPACLDLQCPDSQICVAGECRGWCDGVVCPWGKVCRAGACVDPCASVQCDADYVCELGVCLLQCTCAGCVAPKTCDAPSGHCVDDGCAGVSCDPGSHCTSGGVCVDDCAGAVCPPHELCVQGSCESNPNAGGAGGGGGSGEAGFTGFGGGGSSAAGHGPGGAAPWDATDADSGCGCRLPRRASGSAVASLVLFSLGLGLGLRRVRGAGRPR